MFSRTFKLASRSVNLSQTGVRGLTTARLTALSTSNIVNQPHLFNVTREMQNKASLRAFHYTAKVLTSTPTPTQPQQEVKQEEPKKRMSMKEMVTKYGRLAIGVYLGIYVVFLFSIFIGVSLSNYKAQDIIDYAKTFEFLRGRVLAFLEQQAITYPGLANFVAAWCATKLTEPLRLFLTAIIVPLVVKKKQANVVKALLPFTLFAPFCDQVSK